MHITIVHLAEKLVKSCVTIEKLCNICSAFTEDQLIKIQHRHRYVQKQKVADTCNTYKDELDLLGVDDVEEFFTSRP